MTASTTTATMTVGLERERVSGVEQTDGGAVPGAAQHFCQYDDADQRVEYAPNNCEAGGMVAATGVVVGQRTRKSFLFTEHKRPDFITRDAFGAGETRLDKSGRPSHRPTATRMRRFKASFQSGLVLNTLSRTASSRSFHPLSPSPRHSLCRYRYPQWLCLCTHRIPAFDTVSQGVQPSDFPLAALSALDLMLAYLG
ncbi:hypothetical protein BDZ89DRAFT_1190150 [Hymenopellis radicata]|nr:hypothetical protein BDZ89DRAFT_1190150 [Hymenopellis radicata]